jgi:hypothetical protein
MRKLLIVVLLLTGCATHYARPGVTAAELHDDFDVCKQSAIKGVGAFFTGAGVIFWPLLIVGLPMLLGASASEKSCMHERGYSQEAN